MAVGYFAEKIILKFDVTMNVHNGVYNLSTYQRETSKEIALKDGRHKEDSRERLSQRR